MRSEADRAAEVMQEALLRELGLEVDLVFRYGSVTNGTATRSSDLDISYVPVHESTWRSITVVVDGVLIDLYPIHWSRLERIADYESEDCGVLLVNEVTYQRSDEVAARFHALPLRLKSLLQPEARQAMAKKAQGIFQRIGYDYYLLREQAASRHQFSCLYQARKILHAVCHALAVCNQLLIDTRRLDQVMVLPKLPTDFSATVERLLAATAPDEILGACDLLMRTTRALLLGEQRDVESQATSFPKVFGTVYPELKNMVQHIRRDCERGDMFQGCLMLVYQELMVHISEASTGVQYGGFNGVADYEQDLSALGFPDLLGRFVAKDLSGLHGQCSPFDKHLKGYLERHSVRLNEFANADDLQKRLCTHSEDV